MTAKAKHPRLVTSGGAPVAGPAPAAATEAPDLARLPDVAGYAAGAEVASTPPLPGPFGGDAPDRMLHAGLARLTAGISPAALGLAFTDWWMHLAGAPGKQAQLAQSAWSKATRLALAASRRAGGMACEPCITPERGDKRFSDEAWSRQPFDLVAQGFLLGQQWWQEA
ncbi:MAG TPA: poly-beta-hydroxybutyrate polymerase N-terminal domain-containing protein, partial [Kiloniellaceae bacterium]|nr:poly-beta-hydroxybutyrate polymerase N-terminal domain-containing protein [Kiloniellaceae bacterium]